MTPQQIKTLVNLARHIMSSEWISENQRIKQYMEIMDFLRLARDLYLINEKERAAIADKISAGAMEAYRVFLQKGEQSA